jgi:hypothetical protein
LPSENRGKRLSEPIGFLGRELDSGDRGSGSVDTDDDARTGRFVAMSDDGDGHSRQCGDVGRTGTEDKSLKSPERMRPNDEEV